MAVRIQCDVCDNVASPDTWLGLTMTIPGELLGTFEGEELEIHVCSWRCVYILGRDKIGMTPDAEVDDGPLVKRDEPVYDREEALAELIQTNAIAGAKADAAMQHSIAWGNNPNAGLKQPDAEVPMPGVTKDRQQIRLRRQ